MNALGAVAASWHRNVLRTVRQAGTIGKNVFWPAPNIESGLVRIDCFEDAPWPIDDAVSDHLAPLIALRGDCKVVAKLNRTVLSQHRDNLEVHFAA